MLWTHLRVPFLQNPASRRVVQNGCHMSDCGRLVLEILNKPVGNCREHFIIAQQIIIVNRQIILKGS
jgi:hypothetical protein